MAKVHSDEHILSSIFNPELPFEQISSADQRREKAKDYTEAQENSFDQEKLKKFREIQREAIRITNEKSYESALRTINKAIDLMPCNPSGYNDRAQIERILRRDEDAMASLNRAIELSNGMGTVAAQALTQRALMLKYAGDTEKALADFQAAAKQGSMFAQQEAVKLNPYAALCNSMLKRMMTEVSTGKCTEQQNKCG